MADDLQQDQAGAELPVVPRLPDGDFEGVLTALAGGADAEEALGQLKATVRQSILDAGGSEDAADHAATSFIDTFRSELFEENGSLADAADYADQAMRTAMETYDPAAQAVDPSDALLAAIASGNGVEEAVSRVVAEMGGDMSEADSDRVEGVFLDELQAALSRGESPDAAVAAASQAAETGLDSLKQAEVPVDNPVLSALAGGENVGDALADAAQRSGGDADAFIDGLENALADGADANQAINDAQQAAADSAQARQDSEVELGAADQLAAALASGQKVDEALEQTGGGDAFASALEDALANGAGAGDAMAQADDAQARQDAVAQEQSVPLSPADQLAASLASGENVDQAMQAAGGDDTFAASLEQSLAEGAAPDAAMQSGQQASANAQETQQQQSVPLSPADQLAASLASGQQVDEALQNAGGGDAFGSELEASLAAGETPDQSMASAGAAQQSADTTSSQQEVPADPAVQALAQGGGASGQDLADAVADVTGTTGEPAPQSTQSGEPAAPTQTAETTGGTGEQPAQQGAGSEPQAPATQSAEAQPAETQPASAQSGGETQQQQTAQETQEPAGTQEPAETQTAQTEPSQTGQTQTETGGQETETAQQGSEQEPTQTAQTTEGPGEEIVESVDDVAEAPADTKPDDTDASTDEDVTQTIETASGEAAQDAGTGQTDDDTAEGTETQQTPIAQGGGGDQPTDEEIEALQDIATAAGGNSSGSPSSNLGFNQLLNPTIGNSGLGGGNTQQTTQTQTTTTTTGNTGGGGSDRDTSTVVDNTTTTINSAPVAVDDRGTTQENSVLTVAVTGNDSDPDNDAINVTAARILQANSGTVTFNGGSVTFEPGTDFDDLAVNESRDVNISYTIADNSGATSTATLTVRVTGTNDVPTVSQAIDAGTTDEDALNPIQIDLLSVASDVDTSDDLDTESVVVTSSDGRPVFFDNIDETGALTIDPAQFGDLAVGEHVVLTVSYNVVDSQGAVVANTASVTVEGRNDAPMVVGIVRTATEDGGAVTIGLLGNEVSDDDFTDVLTAQSLTQTGGRDVDASIDGNGNLFFAGGQFEDLDDGESEVLTFTYNVSDGTTAVPNTVSVTITGSNDAPVAVADIAAGTENQSLIIDVLANDTDEDGDDSPANFTLTAASVDGARGSASVAGNQVVFTPGTDFDDLDLGDTETVTITYTMRDDSGAQSTSTVTVTVTGTNDAPTVSGPIDGGTTNEDALTPIQIDLLSVASDVDASDDLDTDSVSVTSSDLRPVLFTIDDETGALTVDPAQFGDLAVGEHVVLTVSYNVVDSQGAVVANTASVTVTGTNDAPMLFGPGALSTTGTGTNGNDASFSYAVASNFDTFPTQAGTVETWVKTTDTSGALISYAVPNSPNELWITLSGGNIQVWLNNSNQGSVDAGSLSDGEWHHVALSFGDGANDTVLYIDGAPVMSLGATNALTSGGTLVMGSDQDSVGGSFQASQALDAEFDGLRVWNGVRSEAQIQATMGTALDPVANPDLVADYGFDGSLESNVPGAPTMILNNAVIVNDDAYMAGNEDTGIPLSGLVALDIDNAPLTVTLQGTNGTISADQGGGAAVVQIVGHTVTITGHPVDVQMALQTAVFTGDANFNGDASVAVTVDDGVAAPVTTDIAIRVAPVNDAPVGLAAAPVLSLDGNFGAVEIAHDAAIDVHSNVAFTMEMMINPDTTSVFQTIIDKSDTALGDYSPYRVHLTANGGISIWNGGTPIDSPAGVIQAGVWQHIATSFDGTTMRIFVDGNEVVSQAFTLGNPNTSNWNIGKDSQAGRNFDGQIDDVRLWSGALDSADLGGAILNSANTPNLLAHWTFDAAPGGVVTDQTGNGHDGTLVAGAAITGTSGTQMTLAEDGTISGMLTAADADLDALTFQVTGNAANGTVNVEANGAYTYTPDPDFNGTDSFTVQVSDGNGGVATQVFTVNVTAVNDAPDVSAVTTSAGEDSGAVSVNLLAGQTDVDGDALSAVSLTQTTGRNVGASIDANGNLVFAGGQFEDLALGGSEVLTFTYNVSDGTTTTPNTVSITMTGANDAPIVTAPSTLTNLGAEFTVHTTTLGDQAYPAMGVLPDGGYVVTWSSQNVDGSGHAIMFQRMAADGTPVGAETRASTYSAGDQINSEIATHADGSFTIVWSSNGQDGSDWSVQAQRFNADGTPNGAEFQLNTDVTIGTQVHPHIQAMPDGGDLIIWSAYNVDGSASAVMMRRFDADGNELTAGPTRVNTTTAGEQYVWTEHGSPMAVYDDGSYVITWASQNVDGSGYAMVAQRYDAAGTPSGGQFQVNTSTLNDQHTGSVAVLDNGNTVFTWSSLMSDGTSWQIHKQVYDAAMNPVGGETTVNTTAAGNQFFPEIAVLTSGNYVIAWTSDVGDGSSYGVFAQEYDADGVAVGGERQLNTFTAGEQRNVKIIPTPDGGYIAGWNSFGQDGSGWSFTLRDAEGGGLSGDENSTFSISGITVADTDGDSLTVTVSVPDGTLSANGGAVSGTSVVLTGTAAAVNVSLSSLMFTPAPDTNGLVDVTVSVNDGTTVTTQTVPVSVQSTNQAPAISGDYTNVTAIADFNGTNAYIDVPDATVNGLTAGTIETWVYLDTNTQETVFAQQANGVNSLAIFRIGDGTPGQVTFQGSNQSGLLTSNSTIPTGEWHHVAITFNGSQANLYIDGQHDASLAGNFGIVGASGGQITGTSIGAWLGDGGGRYFDGQMSEFRIWDHVRSGTEIEDNYQARLTGTEDGLRALYNFTDGFAAGGAVADATGTYDAVSVNATGTFDETFTVAVASEDFEGGASGWSNNSTTYTGTVLTDFLGSFGNGGATSKTFTLPAGANETTISFDFYKMDSWDGENFQIQIGGQTVAARSFNFSTGVASPVGGIDDTVAVTFSDGVDHGAIVNAGWNDYSFRVELTLTEAQIAALPVDANGNPMLQLGFTSTLDQGITDESWGIDNLSISAEVPVDGIEAGSGVLQSNLLSDASDPDGDALSVSNVSFSSSNAARTVSFTVDAMTGVLSIDTAQFANLGAGRSETITVTYDVVDPEGATATGSRSFTINGTQNAISLGSSDYVEIDHHADLEPGTGDMTAEMWFYWPGAGGVSGLQFLMSKGNTDGSTDPGYSLFMNGNTLIARTSTGAGQGELEVDMSGIDAGWHHVAMVIDQSSDPTDGQLTAYLDGSTAGWQIAGGGYDDVWTKGDISSASDALMIGDPAYSPSAQGSGYTHPMDEVRIWDTARTEVEINQTMHQQLNGNEAGLSGYWTFNESVGSTVTDLTGNGHDGTMSANAARENLIELSISNNEVYRGLLMGSDPEGDALSYSISTGPQHGSVSFDGNTFVYDHDGSGFSDSFTVEISDGTDTVTEQIDVTVV